MKKNICITLLATAMLCCITDAKPTLCGSYSNNKVYISDLLEDINRSSAEKITEEKLMQLPDLSSIIEDYIWRQILKKEAKASKITKKGGARHTEYKQAKETLKSSLFLQNKIENATSEQEIHNEYVEFTRKLKEKGQVEIQCAVFKNKNDAAMFIQDLKSGKKTFENIKQKGQGAAIETNKVSLEPGMLPIIIEDEIFKLGIGSVSQPLETQSGFIVVKVINKKIVNQPPSYASKKEYMKNRCVVKNYEKLKQEMIKKYNVQVHFPGTTHK